MPTGLLLGSHMYKYEPPVRMYVYMHAVSSLVHVFMGANQYMNASICMHIRTIISKYIHANMCV